MLQLIKDYFELSNTEQKGFIALLFVVVALLIAPRMWSLFREPSPEPSVSFVAWVEEKEKEEKQQNQASKFTPVKKVFELNPFNPNTASLEELTQLGIPKYTAQTLINFRNKGGQFYTKKDLLKVYGFRESDYNRLEAYISIPPKPKTAFDKPTSNYTKEKKIAESKEIVAPILIDLNTADSAQFTQLRGIGPVYAARIVKFRKILHGFTHKEQLMEVYGITDSLYQTLAPKCTLSQHSFPPIPINSANTFELKSHPYITEPIAKGIINYRTQNGPFQSINDLQNLYLIDSAKLARMAPYLSVE